MALLGCRLSCGRRPWVAMPRVLAYERGADNALRKRKGEFWADRGRGRLSSAERCAACSQACFANPNVSVEGHWERHVGPGMAGSQQQQCTCAN